MFLQWLQVLYLTLSLGRSRLGSITAIARQPAVPSLVSSACGLGLFVPGNLAHVASCLCAVPIWPRASWQGTQAAGPGGQAGWQVEKNASHAGTIEAWLPWSWVFLHYAPTLSWKSLSHRTSVLGLKPRRCF